VDAGCEIVASTGSQSCRWRLEKWGLQGKVVKINSMVTEMIKKCITDNCYVAGTMTPSGRMLKALGDLDPEDLYNAYREEVIGYVEGGADILWIMTMMDLEEALIALRAARDFSKLPVIASMSFDCTPKGPRTIMGVDPKTAARRLIEAGADVVGHNCGGATPKESTLILREIANVTTRPLVVKPNAGKPDVKDGKPSWPFTPDHYAEEVRNWIASGARIIGGCCGTTPEHARRMKGIINNFSK